MKKLFTGKTARQELVAMACTKIRAGICSTPHGACEAVVFNHDPMDGTLGGAISEYYQMCSDNALRQVLREIEKTVRVW
jgi:hypothetical protein